MPVAPIELRIEGTDAGAQQALDNTQRAVGRLNRELQVTGNLFRSQFSAQMFVQALREATKNVGDLSQSLGGLDAETAKFTGSLANIGVSAAISPMLALGQAVGLLSNNLSAVASTIRQVRDAQKGIGSEEQGFFGAMFDFKIKTEGQRGAAAAGRQAWHGAEGARLAQEIQAERLKQETPSERIIRLKQEFEDYASGKGSGWKPSKDEVSQARQLMLLKSAESQKQIARDDLERANADRKLFEDQQRAEEQAQEKKRRAEEEFQDTIKRWELENLKDYEDGQRERQRAEQKRIEAGQRAELKRAQDLETDVSQRAAKAEATAQQLDQVAGDAKAWAMLPPGEALRRRRQQRQDARRQEREERALERRIEVAEEKDARGATLSSREKEALRYSDARADAFSARMRASLARREEAEAQKNIAAIKAKLETLSDAVTALLGV